MLLETTHAVGLPTKLQVYECQLSNDLVCKHKDQMQFFDRLKGALESVGGAATSAVLTLLEPEVSCSCGK